jgi:hypothetical protein
MGITVTGGISFGSGLAVTASAPAPAASYYLAVACSDLPSIMVYPWSSSGFGTKFADPTTVPAAGGTSVAFSPQGDAVALGHAYNQFSVYQWSSSGFGTKFAGPTGFTGGEKDVASFSPSGDAIVCRSTRGIFVYSWSSSGFGTKFADPAGISGQVYDASFPSSGNTIAIALKNSPYVAAYPWSGSGFGAKYSDPATLPAEVAFSVAFSSSGDAISVGGDPGSGSVMSVYPWSGSGFGTKFTNPGGVPTSPIYSTTFSPSDNALASTFFSYGAVNGLFVWQWSSSGFGTKFADPSPALGSQDAVAFSPLGDAIAVVAGYSSPNMNAYPWSGSGFGTRFANPATMPAVATLGSLLSLNFGTIQ